MDVCNYKKEVVPSQICMTLTYMVRCLHPLQLTNNLQVRQQASIESVQSQDSRMCYLTSSEVSEQSTRKIYRRF